MIVLLNYDENFISTTSGFIGLGMILAVDTLVRSQLMHTTT